MKKLKYIFFINLMLILASCTVLDDYNGKKYLDLAVSSFNTQGTNYNGAKELIKALGYLKESQEAKSIFEREYEKSEIYTKSILNKSNQNSNDIEILKTYVYLNEEGQKLKSQGYNLDFNREYYLKNKLRINKILESYIIKEDLSQLTRRGKINKLNSYKDMLTYNPSLKITNKIINLEKEVRVNIKLIARNLRLRRLGRILEDGVEDYFYRNRNDFQNDYIYLTNLNIGSYKPSSNFGGIDYIIDIDFYRANIYSDVIERKDKEGRRIYLRRVYIDIDADLELIERKSLQRIARRSFSINRDFTNLNNFDLGPSFNNLPFNVENYIEDEIEDELERNIRYLLRGI